MYQIIKNVIERGGYDLTAILQKVNTLWENGNITDEQYDELLGLEGAEHNLKTALILSQGLMI